MDGGVTEGMVFASMASAAAGTAVSAYSSYEQGKAQQQQALYQSAVALNNQKIAQQYATAELQKGDVQEQEKRQQTAQAISAERAAVGANGLDVNTGSPLRLQADTAAVGELDAQTIRNNAQRAAYGYEVQGMNFAANAGLEESAAANAARFGALGAFSSIIGGATTVSNRWLTFRNAGIGSGGGPPDVYGA